MDINQIIIFALIVMATYFIEGLIGFGGTIMALPLAAAVVGLKLTVPVMTIVVLVASIIIAVRDRKYIDKTHFRRITFFMILGLPIGMYLFKSLPERPLKIVLGIFMIIVGIKGLYDILSNKENKAKTEETKQMEIIHNAILFLGGIIHGAFTCGGPFVVVYATKNIKEKTSFRATLCALWATLNTIMLSINVVNGDVNKNVIILSIITVAFVTVSIKVSNIVHKKIDGDAFTKFVYVALIVSGVLMAR